MRNGTSFGLSPLFFFSLDSMKFPIQFIITIYLRTINVYGNFFIPFVSQPDKIHSCFSDCFLARLKQFCNGLDATGQIFNYYLFTFSEISDAAYHYFLSLNGRCMENFYSLHFSIFRDT